MNYRYIGKTDLILKSKKDEVQLESTRVSDNGYPLPSCTPLPDKPPLTIHWL